jgi:dynein heavy chain
MKQVFSNPRILVVTERNDLIPIIQENSKIMDRTLKSLNGFLEVKRQAFPRFYFLSNTELLDLLTDSSNFQLFMSKCFQGIYTLTLDKVKNISGMISHVSSVDMWTY